MFALAFDNELFLSFVKEHLEYLAALLEPKVPQVSFLSSLAQKKNSFFVCHPGDSVRHFNAHTARGARNGVHPKHADH